MPLLSTLLAGGVAAGLGVAGWVSARERQRVASTCPPLGSFVEIDGGRLHYVDRGQGADVVLVHGASTNLRDFDLSILHPLAERHRVLAFDRPGYGYSDRPARHMSPADQARALREALRRLGVERPLLVGHSWAGSLVLAYALAHPDELRGVAVLSGATHPWPGGVALYRYLGATPGLGPLLASTLIWPIGGRMVDAAIRATLSPADPPPRYREQSGIELLFRPSQFCADASDVTRLCRFVRWQSLRYGELKLPLTIVTGRRDPIVSPELHSHALHAQVPHSKLIVLESAGHAPHHSHRQDVLEAIDALVEETR